MRERLAELLMYATESTTTWGYDSFFEMADYLLANGVIVPPVNVGQTVWVIVEKEQPLFCRGKEPYYRIYKKDAIVCGEVNSLRVIRGVDAPLVWSVEVCGLVKDGNGSLAFFELRIDDICKTNKVFTAQEEAERALAERNGSHE